MAFHFLPIVVHEDDALSATCAGTAARQSVVREQAMHHPSGLFGPSLALI
jgi:hypothetical protein